MSEQNRRMVEQWLMKSKSDWVTIEILTASEKCPASLET